MNTNIQTETETKTDTTTKVTLNSNCVNAKIKAHILPDALMQQAGFTDKNPQNWYYCKNLGNNITFNVTIPKDGSDINIDVIDEYWLQIYDYQLILHSTPEHTAPEHKFANHIKELVEVEMEYLQNAGVLEGHVRGEYI